MNKNKNHEQTGGSKIAMIRYGNGGQRHRPEFTKHRKGKGQFARKKNG